MSLASTADRAATTARSGAADAPPALLIEHVSHAFGARKALDDVSLEVPQGGFVALLGLNGAGKTTLFSLITRLYDNVSGGIEIMGSDLRRQPSAALGRLGVVFQARTLDLDLSVRQNLVYHAALHGLSPREGLHRAERQLDRVGLLERLDDSVRGLSGGQQRRVEIARALLHDPRALILDEPTVGLDIESRQAIQATVRSLVDDDGLGVLWATHLFDEVHDDDAVVVLHKGKVALSGRAGAIAATAESGTLAGAIRALTGTAATAQGGAP